MNPVTDQWSLKEYCPKGSPERWFFRKNLTPTPSPGTAGYRHIAYLTLHFQRRDESGLPSLEDEARLFEIEENDVLDLERRCQSVHVASVLKSGVKDLLFYIQDPHIFLEHIIEFRSRHASFSVECEIIEDPSWEHYADFP